MMRSFIMRLERETLFYISYGFLEAFVQGDMRFRVSQRSKFSDIGASLLHPIPISPRLFLYSCSISHQRVDPFCDEFNFHFLSRTDIESFSDGVRMCSNEESFLDYFFYKIKIPGFFARAGEQEGFPLQGQGDEIRNHIPILPRKLSWTITIEITKNDRGNSEKPVKIVAVEFPEVLMNCIGSMKIFKRSVLCSLVVIAIHAGGGGKNESLYLTLPCPFEKPQRS